MTFHYSHGFPDSQVIILVDISFSSASLQSKMRGDTTMEEIMNSYYTIPIQYICWKIDLIRDRRQIKRYLGLFLGNYLSFHISESEATEIWKRITEENYQQGVCEEDYEFLEIMVNKLKFWKDKEFLSFMVDGNGLTLRHLSDKFRNDKEIVLNAVKNNGLALEFASVNMRNDKQVVLRAIKNKIGALEYASTELKKDKDVISVVQNPITWYMYGLISKL
ncbi:predicted protein [Naegleria gruberi]|uniref:Predicted protein n=1 Tax=Naegleria gruberi TaxID=5762 RepID=D2V484_NAEGR|nr:uncharacterized protein NAEGRDRAFT_63632 [Naegleria gruberi]EFC48473.1 predicted protein [Naegleria gruberi]|eukprot:XP_002681217.1 predicted protein [Naegleria gruberi strain NEG-M]